MNRQVTVLGDVVAKYAEQERRRSLLEQLDRALQKDPTCVTIAATAAARGWSAEETGAYTIMCLLARARNAERALIEERMRTISPPVILVGGPLR